MDAPRERIEPEAGAVVLRGALLELREPAWADEREFVALRTASREFLAPWEALIEGDDPFGPERFRRFMARSPRRRRFLIRRRDDGRLGGAISLSGIERAARRATVGFWLGAEHARQGLMSEALELVARWSREELALLRLEAFVLPENQASIGLLRKRRFAFEALVPSYRVVAGRPRDHELWARALVDP